MRSIQNNFYWNAPIWDEVLCPKTIETAAPSSRVWVSDVVVLKVHDNGAFHRGSYFSGNFLIDQPDDKDSFKPDDIESFLKAPDLVDVYCLWFGHRLKTRGLEFTVDPNKLELRLNYMGFVVSDLSEKRWIESRKRSL